MYMRQAITATYEMEILRCWALLRPLNGISVGILPCYHAGKELMRPLSGEVLSFRASYRSGSVDPEPMGWKLEKSAGGSVLADLGSTFWILFIIFWADIGSICL